MTCFVPAARCARLEQMTRVVHSLQAENNTVNASDAERVRVARLERVPSRTAEALHRVAVVVFRRFSLKHQTARLKIATVSAQ